MYDPSIYEQVSSQFRQKRERAELLAEKRKQELFKAIPRLSQIEQELAGTGISIAKVILMTKGDTSALMEELKTRNLALQKEMSDLIQDAGFPADYLEPQYECRLCADRGHNSHGMCDCFKKALQKKAAEALNDLTPADESGFEQFKLSYYPDQADHQTGINPRLKMEQIYRYCFDYANHFSRSSPNLLLLGETGLGKTHLSLAIAKEVISQGNVVVYSSAQNLLNKIEREKFSRDYSAADSLESALKCDLLIIDDLGAEFTTQFVISTIYNIVNTRINERRPTIISTNYNGRQLEEKYTNRVMSRFVGSYETLRFIGKDIRQIRRNESRR